MQFNLREFIRNTVAEYSKGVPQQAYHIISLKYEDAKPVNDLIRAGKLNDAIKYLAQWDYGHESEHTVDKGFVGTHDKVHKNGPYILVWSPLFDDTVHLYRTARGRQYQEQFQESIKRSELKVIIKETLRVILNEMMLIPIEEEEDTIKEETTTGDVEPINLPGSAIPGSKGKSGWVAKRGGSLRALQGSPSGMTLTPIGAQDFKRKQDPVYE